MKKSAILSTLLCMIGTIGFFSTEQAGGKDLVAYWSFDESGATIADLSGNGNNGLVEGKPKWIKGIKGNAIALDGYTYVNCGNRASLNGFGTGGITVEAWVYIAKSPEEIKAISSPFEFPAIVDKSVGDWISPKGDKCKGFNLLFLNGAKAIFWGIGDGIGYVILQASPPTGKWIHLAGTADSASERNPKVSLYLDGALASSAPRTCLAAIDVDQALHVGLWKNPKRYFSGAIDEVKIYNRALNANEIKASYGKGKASYLKPKKEIKLPEDIVIPTPKELTSTGETIPLTSAGKILFDIMLSDSPTETEKIAAQELASEIFKISGIKEGIKVRSEKESSDKKVIFALGTDLALFKKYKVTPPLKKEGYAIGKVKDGDQDVILLAGRDKVGAYWAVQTLYQLIKKDKNETVFTVCEIKDWPTYAIRNGTLLWSYLNSPVPESTLLQPVRYKFNTLATCGYIDQKNWSNSWHNPGQPYMANMSAMSEFYAKRGLKILQIVNPVCVKNWERYGESDKIKCSNKEDLDKLFNVYKASLDQGNTLIGFDFDDAGTSAFNEKGQRFLTQPEDNKTFAGNLGKAHSYALRELYKRVKKDYPDCEITFLPPQYDGVPKLDDYYFKELKDVPQDIIFVWAGPWTQSISLSYTEEQCKNYQAAIGGRRFIVHDNAVRFPDVQAMDAGLSSDGDGLFDLYGERYDGLWKYCYGIKGTEYFGRSVIMDFEVMMIAEYAWNADRYNPELARRKVLSLIAGRDAVDGLAAFQETYLQVMKEYIKGRPSERAANLKTGLATMKELLEEIKKKSTNAGLVKELEDRYYKLIEKVVFEG